MIRSPPQYHTFDPDTVVLAGSGPSLCEVDWGKMPICRIAAINKSIYSLPRIDFWFLVDGHPERIYPYVSGQLIESTHTAKCIPENKIEGGLKYLYENGQNVCTMKRSGGKGQDEIMRKRGRSVMDGKAPLFYLENKTALFAVEWLSMGYKRIIFAGVDLKFRTNKPHCDGSPMTRNECHRTRTGLDEVFTWLSRMAPVARGRGIEFLSASPGRINDIMPRWEGASDGSASDQPEAA